MLLKIVNIIDTVNEWCGKVAGLLGYLLFIIVVVGVFFRKVLNHPFIWNFEASYMSYAAMFLLGLGYTLKHKMHVTIDVIYSAVGKKAQLVLDILGFIIFLIPFAYVSLKSTTTFAIQSWQILEHSQSTWAPPIYPFKTLMPVSFSLLVLQAIAELIKSIYIKGKGQKL